MGLGSDELFMGYHYFKRAQLFRFIQKLPKVLKWPFALVAMLGGKYAKLIYLYNGKGLIHFYLSLRGLFSPSEIASISKINEVLVWNYIAKLEDTVPVALNDAHPADALSWLEVNFYMANQLLKDTDFMSMRHSIEVRVPFLDHLLVEYVSSLPLTKTARPKDSYCPHGSDLPRSVGQAENGHFPFKHGNEALGKRIALVLKTMSNLKNNRQDLKPTNSLLEEDE